MTASTFDDALRVLRTTAQTVKQVEDNAKAWLAAGGDAPGYTNILLGKVAALEGLPDALRAHLTGLEAEVRDIAETTAADFARRAGAARRVGSSFYMSALLYPDDWSDGQPNDLEAFVEEFEEFRP